MIYHCLIEIICTTYLILLEHLSFTHPFFIFCIIFVKNFSFTYNLNSTEYYNDHTYQFILNHISVLDHFPFARIIFFFFPYSVGLLVRNSSSLWFSESLFISPTLLKNIFLGCIILYW